jgi:methyl-accepting chemotaxis protein
VITNSIEAMDKNKISSLSAIEGISAITEENAASSEEIAATMDNQLDMMIQIKDRTEIVDGISQQLADLIKKFKL